MSEFERASIFYHIFDCIKSKKLPDRPFIVFISGIDACGKSRFTQHFEAFLRGIGKAVQTVHVDDFHHPKSHRYNGEDDPATLYYTRSFDLETLTTRVLSPIRRHSHLQTSLTLLDLATDRPNLRRTYEVSVDTIVLVEGVFLWRDELREFCDLFVYLHVSLGVGFKRARIRDCPRDGDEAMDKYISKYYPAQIRYIRRSRPTACADVLIDNTDFESPQLLPNDPIPYHSTSLAGMRVDAVCFDLWNTLIPLPTSVKCSAFNALAEHLGVEPDVLAPKWAASRRERETSMLRPFLSNFCRRESIAGDHNVYDRIISSRHSIHGEAIRQPRCSTEITLRMLRAHGYRIGLVSNCTSDIPGMLRHAGLDTLFDSIVFSFEVGALKPEPVTYLTVAQRLGVSPASCLYVGDGNDDELSGATAVGMRSVLLETEQSREWGGCRIADLSDLLFSLIP